MADVEEGTDREEKVQKAKDLLQEIHALELTEEELVNVTGGKKWCARHECGWEGCTKPDCHQMWG